MWHEPLWSFWTAVVFTRELSHGCHFLVRVFLMIDSWTLTWTGASEVWSALSVVLGFFCNDVRLILYIEDIKCARLLCDCEQRRLSPFPYLGLEENIGGGHLGNAEDGDCQRHGAQDKKTVVDQDAGQDSMSHTPVTWHITDRLLKHASRFPPGHPV